MSLRHPKPAPATSSAGKRAGALPIRCELLLVATLEDAGELVGQFECPLIRQLQRQMGTDRFDRAQAALRTGNVHGYPPERVTSNTQP